MQTFSTGETFSNFYGVATINLPYIFDAAATDENGNLGALRPLKMSDLGGASGIAGFDGRPYASTPLIYGKNSFVKNYSSFAEPSVDYILDETAIVTGADGTITFGAWRPKNTDDFNIRTIKNRVTVGNSNYTGKLNDFLIAFTGLDAKRTGVLPNAAQVSPNHVYVIKDETAFGLASGFNVVITGTNCLIDGAQTKSLTTGYQSLTVYSNGTNYFSWSN